MRFLRPIHLLAVGTSSLLLVACAEYSQGVNVPVSISGDHSKQSNGLSAEILDEVKRYRQANGGSPVLRHRGLDKLAQNHASYLLNNRGRFSLYGKTVSHYGFDGRSLVALERMGFDSVSENIASISGGTRGAAQSFRWLWANSKGHEENMRAGWTHTGMGVAVADDGLIIAVQMFGSISIRSHYDMVDKFRNF